MKKREFFARYAFMAVIILAFAVAFIIRLVNIEVTGQGYTEDTSHAEFRTRTEPIQALRGEIYDRNGKPLVTNEYYYEIYFDAGSFPTSNEKKNDLIVSFMKFTEENGEKDAFTLPDSPFLAVKNQSGTEINYEYNSAYMDTAFGRRFKKLILDVIQKEEMPPAAESVEILKKRFGLADAGDRYTDEELDLLFYVRTDMELRYFSTIEPYTVLKDVSLKYVTQLAECNYRGVKTRTVVNRVYGYPGAASHLIGRCGRIQADRAEYYKELGYPNDAVVGLTGAEEAFEEYLRGVDGEMTIEEDEYGNVIRAYVSKEPVPGKNVYLTIDIDMQIKAEAALKDNIDRIVAEAEEKILKDGEKCVGEDANAGAITLVNVNTGEVIAAATYPTFDLVTFDEDYDSLREDERAPLFNRALEGTYAPGSTFKPGVAAAALEENVITPYTELECTGVYEYYKDTGFEPKCWIYNMYGGRHGRLAVTDAIKVSCNCFFYETGRLLTIKKMNKYCKGYGLGQPTGCELREKKGVLAGPEYREENGLEAWTDGQTITAAIGQSDNLFTPLQISVYISTLINHGSRYKAHFLYQVREFYTNEIIYQQEPEIIDDSVKLSDGTVAIVLNAMKDVVEDQTGSAAKVFNGYPMTIGGKTGTAQVKRDESDNAVFTAFAPFSSPEVVSTCVIEHGANGGSAGYAVRDVFTSYFGLDTGEDDADKDENADEQNRTDENDN